MKGPPQTRETWVVGTLPDNDRNLLQVYIVCSILLFTLPQLSAGYGPVRTFLLPHVLPIIHIALVGSIYSTAALALERYITVCHPFVRYRYTHTQYIYSIMKLVLLYL